MPLAPYFATPDRDEQGQRRLLLVSYHFPPAAAVGARRWEKLVHYAAQRGWGVDVIAQRDDPPGTPLPEAALARLRTLPEGIRVYGVPLPVLPIQRVEQRLWAVWRGGRATAEGGAAAPGAPSSMPALPSSVAREAVRWALHTPRGFLRAYWTWLDAARVARWGRDAAAVARGVVVPGVHRGVINSGPPHMTHDGGRRIAAAAGLPFVMDMRDPWYAAERLPESQATPLWLRLAARYEGRAVRAAALVVANTELARRGLQVAYPDRRDDIVTVMNGADDDPLPPPRRSGRFVIAHAGTVYLDRDPRPLFQGAAAVIRALGVTPEQLSLEFMGEMDVVGGFPIREVAEQEGIAAYVHTTPPRPHAQAMEFMANATMLVTMSGSSAAAIPAKTFECIRFDAWVLALSAPGSATDLVLQGTGADVVPSGDAAAIARVIRERYLQHAAGVIPPRIGGDGGENDRFSRRYQANILFEAIERRIG